MIECHACGAELDSRDKFCSKCGAITEQGQEASVLAGRYVADLFDGLAKLAAGSIAFATDPDNRIKVGVGAAMTAILLLALTDNPISRGLGEKIAAKPDAPTYEADGTPNFADHQDVFVGDESQFLVTGNANIRDFPTSQGSSIVGSLVESDIIDAREVMAFDPSSQWFKLTSGGYVWGANLSKREQTKTPVEAREVRPQEIAVLSGTWSDRATCYGEPRDIELVLSGDSVIMGSESYALIDQSENRVRIFSTQETDQRQRSKLAIDMSPRAEVILVSFPDAMDAREYPFYPAGTACSERPKF